MDDATPADQTPIFFYSSSSGQTRLFARNLERPVLDLADRRVRAGGATGPWVLLTPSYKTGNPDNDTLPEPVRRFLSDPVNRRLMVGIIGAGNRSFGSHYQSAARLIARTSGRPILFEVELSGTPEDVVECRAVMARVDRDLATAPSE
ncbi:class Ib ribonucleoside-diphosphate reductase assembly flavoprotein NrdI [Oerskovia enterophila]|uniref:NrdI-like protein n=1 Tax=Oerskovia enterophila TaxID=43678 RepID=A0ABX2Y8D1_9CELL|nr:class Ib ribonucleoside-diphosphate reductase assembly flavoprotein NrdI [Oerskovia enterophila]OCI32819.1 putative NrdI-like protein [Oerskovia enterophila]